MRKSLLVLTCAAMAVSASAQQTKITTPVERVAHEVEMSVKPADALLEKGAVEYKAEKSAADGVYYKTPTGSMWVSPNRPLYGYGTPYHLVAPLTEFVYTNMSTKKDGKWTVKTASSEIDMTKNVDEECNLHQSYSGGQGAYYAPDYTEGEISYIPSTSAGATMVNYVQGLNNQTFFTNNVGDRKFYGGGSLAPLSNLYGAGSINEVAAQGFLYTTPKPMSPLYVESVWCWATDRAAEDNPVNGQTLTLLIYNREDTLATEPVYTLTCTPDQCVKDRDGYYILNFTQKQEDPISGETVDAPFVFDFSAEMYFLGFDQEGVTAGVMGTDVMPEFLTGDNSLDQSFMLVGDKMYRYSETVAYVGFTAFFDKIEVWKEMEIDTLGNTAHVNGMLVSNDGQTCKNVVYDENKGAMVETALDWFEVDSEGVPTGVEYYWSDDAAEVDWIEGISCSELLDEEEYLVCYEVSVTCAPLPDGVEKRKTIIHLNGYGAISDDIYVFQGAYTAEEIEEELGVQSIAAEGKQVSTFSNKIYNIAGQQVSKDYKGLIIRDGKKMMNK